MDFLDRDILASIVLVLNSAAIIDINRTIKRNRENQDKINLKMAELVDRMADVQTREIKGMTRLKDIVNKIANKVF